MTPNFKEIIQKYIENYLNLPSDASYVCIYSEVINCETKAVLPVPASPNRTTRYLGNNNVRNK